MKNWPQPLLDKLHDFLQYLWDSLDGQPAGRPPQLGAPPRAGLPPRPDSLLQSMAVFFGERYGANGEGEAATSAVSAESSPASPEPTTGTSPFAEEVPSPVVAAASVPSEPTPSMPAPEAVLRVPDVAPTPAQPSVPEVVPAPEPIDVPPVVETPVALPQSETADSEESEDLPDLPAGNQTTSVAMGPVSETGDEYEAAAKGLLHSLDAVPDGLRTAKHAAVLRHVERLRNFPKRVLQETEFLRAVLDLDEELKYFSIILKDLAPACDLMQAALELIPGIITPSEEDVGEADYAEVPASAPVGKHTRLLRPGFKGANGAVLKPKVMRSSRQVSTSREKVEWFRILYDVIQSIHPERFHAKHTQWLARAGELFDSLAHGDPTAHEAFGLLTDCLKFVDLLEFYYSVPELEGVMCGVRAVRNLVGDLLRSHGVRVYPSEAQPFREGKPAPAPYPQIVLKEVPDPSPYGHLLRIKNSGYTREGRVEREPVLMISAGPKHGQLGKALAITSIELRRRAFPGGVQGNPKEWERIINVFERCVIQWVEGEWEDSKEKSGLALREMINLLDGLYEDGPVRKASDVIADHLVKEFGWRVMKGKVGQVVDSSFDPAKYDFERLAGSGKQKNTILHLKRRGFIDQNNLTVQKALLVLAGS